MLAPGKIIEVNDRVFIVSELHYDEDGDLDTIHARCITPKEGDKGEWFSLEVSDEDLLVAHTIQ